MNTKNGNRCRLAAVLLACSLIISPVLAAGAGKPAGAGAQKPAKPAKPGNRNSVLPGNARG